MLAVLTFSLLTLAFVTTWAPTRFLKIAIPKRYEGTVGELMRAELHVENASSFACYDLVFVHGETKSENPRPVGSLQRIGGRTKLILPIELRPRERGRLRTLVLTASTKAPLGFFSLSKTFELPVDLWALPRRGRWNAASLTDRRMNRDVGKHSLRPLEEELYGLHEWRPGESLRRVHWRLSARLDEWIVRELHSPFQPPVVLWLVTQVQSRGLWGGKDPSFEKACSLVATLAESFLTQGHEVRLGFFGTEPSLLQAFRGRQSLRRLLRTLALAHATKGDPWAFQTQLKELSTLGRRRQSKPQSSQTADWSVVCLAGGAASLAPLFGRRQWVFDVDDPELDLYFAREQKTSNSRKSHSQIKEGRRKRISGSNSPKASLTRR